MSGSQINADGKRCIRLLRPHGNLLEPFQFTEEIFNQMPSLIHLLVILARCLTVTARRDNHFTAASGKILDQPIRIKRLIRQQSPKFSVSKQRFNPANVMTLPG